MERRLAAILAADVAGYNRLMAADEEGVFRRQHGRGLDHRAVKKFPAGSSFPQTLGSPTRVRRSTYTKWPKIWACDTCWKAGNTTSVFYAGRSDDR